MKNIKLYELWGDEDLEKEEGIELLSKMVELSKKDIISHFNSRLMDVDFVDVDDPEKFVIEYWPKSFDGRIPQRISYYIDDIAEILSEEFGTKVDWQFSPNGNVQRIEFDLEKEIDPKYFSAKDRMKFS
jgi:hypothetical protein